MIEDFPAAMLARGVQLVVLAFVGILLTAFVAVESFSAEIGRPIEGGGPAAGLARAALADIELAAVVATHEAEGLVCRIEPALTDIVVFETADGGAIQTLTFTRAVAASTRQEGWIRRYCL